MKDISIPEGLGEGDTFVENGIRFTIKNGDLTVRDLDLGEYLYVVEGDTPEAAKKKAAKARHLIVKNLDDLKQFGSFHSVSEMIEIGKGGLREVTAFYLTEDPLYYLVPMTRTKKGRELRILMTHVFIAWRKGRLGPSEPMALPPPATKPRPQKSELTLHRESDVEARDEQRRRDHDLHWPTPFLVDHKNALRIRYDKLARTIGMPMENVWFAVQRAKEPLRRIAPFMERTEDGPCPYQQLDGGYHEAAYLTLGQAHHMCFELKTEDAWNSVISAFDAYNAFLSGETEREATYRKAREADAARLAATPTTFNLIEAMAERTAERSEAATDRISGEISALAGSVTRDVSTLTASIEELPGLLKESLQKKPSRLWPFS